jgi:hypothetical protein
LNNSIKHPDPLGINPEGTVLLINHVPAQNTTSAIKIAALLFIIFPSRFDIYLEQG